MKLNFFFSLRHASLERSVFRRFFRLLTVFAGLSFCAPAHSQTLGRISGIVTDSSGGAIVGARVTVTDVSRGIARTLTTDSSGNYSAPNLTPGTYSVHATYIGFQAFDRQDVLLGVAADVHVDVTLQPGEQTQTITVTGETPTITTTNAQLQGTINAGSLSDLPFSGHNYVQLLGLLPTLQLRPGQAPAPRKIIPTACAASTTSTSSTAWPTRWPITPLRPSTAATPPAAPSKRCCSRRTPSRNSTSWKIPRPNSAGAPERRSPSRSSRERTRCTERDSLWDEIQP